MASNILFKYGDYNFRPRPLFQINSQPLKTPDGSGYGIKHSVSMNGSILLTGSEVSDGTTGLFNKIESLKDALNADGRLLVIACDSTPIISGYPVIEKYDIQPASDNYTRQAKYTIDFVMPTTVLGTGGDVFNSSVMPPFIESCTEAWDVEFQEEKTSFDWTLSDGTFEKFGYKLAVTHTVDVQSRITYTGTEIPNVPWQDAKAFAETKLGFNSEFVNLSGILSLPGSGYFTTNDVYNQYRQVFTDKTGGGVKVVETFIVSPSGSGSLPNNAIETFNISTSQNDGIVSVALDGEIQGFDDISYTGDGGSNSGFYVNNSKFEAASGYYNIVKDRMYARANTAYNAVTGSCYDRPLSSVVRARTVGLYPLAGRVAYNYSFDTTPSSCITGSCILSQNLSINDTLQNDVFASQPIIGRAFGPILQDLNTVTSRVRTVNVDLVVLPPTGCGSVDILYEPVPTGAIQSFIDTVAGELISNYNQVFISSHSQNWDFTVGRYSRNIGFTYSTC